MFQGAEELNHLMNEGLAFWNGILTIKKKNHSKGPFRAVLTESSLGARHRTDCFGRESEDTAGSHTTGVSEGCADLW